MSELPVIELRDLRLRYRLARQKVSSFKEYLIHFIRGNLEYRQLWAVNGIDLTVGRGEVLGICGRNGAGKSTLLKVISGVFPPTHGERIVRGKISPILELGTGFDPELTGVENVYLNALLRGHRRAEVDEKLDEILEFSGLDDFVHSPVRNYSTGMMARLGFSVATAWVPEVLVLDEVLSVGDARFLIRCHERIESFRDAGTTVLIVSHSPSALLNNCTRVVWIEQGKIVQDGPSTEVVRAYAEFAGDQPTLALLSGEPSAEPEADAPDAPAGSVPPPADVAPVEDGPQ